MSSISKANAKNSRTSTSALYNQNTQIGKVYDTHTIASLQVLSFSLSSSVRSRIVLTSLSSSPASAPKKQIEEKKKKNKKKNPQSYHT